MNSKEVARIYLLETLRIQWITHITYWKMWSSKIILQSLKATRIQRLLSWTRKIKLRILTAQKMKLRFPLRFSSINVTKPAVQWKIPSLIYHMPIRQLNKLWEMLAITLEFQFYLSLFLNLLDTKFFVSWNLWGILSTFWNFCTLR